MVNCKLSKRLLSLDVLRGITVAGMILVNNAGGPQSYASLQHSAWNGLTPCDLVFPFFLFIMGISTYIALRKFFIMGISTYIALRKFQFQPSAAVWRKILRRTVLIFLIGVAIHWFDQICGGEFFAFDTLRITGVLQRIALCYCVVSLLALYLRPRQLGWTAGIILVAYAALLMLGGGYVNDENNVLVVADRALLGTGHLYAKMPVDPEGIVSTLPAIAHTLIGFLCGRLIMEADTLNRKIIGLFVTGFLLMAVGFLLTEALPLNKRVWSPSYTLVTCGLAASLQAALMYFIDGQGKKNWCRFFEVFGVNPLFLYVLSEVVAIVLGATEAKPVIYGGIHAVVTDPYLASAIYSLLFVAVMGAAGYPLYKKKIYIKI